MLRVNVGLSRKLSKDYNSTGFTINLDGEILAPVSDPEAVMEQVKELFDLAEEALDQQIERAQGEAAIGSRDVEPQREPSPRTNGRRPADNESRATHNGNGKTAPNANGQQDDLATNKQVQFMLGIAKRQGLSTAELERKIAEVLARDVGLYDITKREAAKVIDFLANQPTNGRSYARR